MVTIGFINHIVVDNINNIIDKKSKTLFLKYQQLGLTYYLSIVYNQPIMIKELYIFCGDSYL